MNNITKDKQLLSKLINNGQINLYEWVEQEVGQRSPKMGGNMNHFKR
jgi:hypothetical protein